VVGQLPRVQEKEENDTYETAQVFQPPAAIEGELPAGDKDVFRFRGKKGQRIVVDALCARIGSGVDARLSLFTADREFIPATEAPDGFTVDPRLFAELPKDADYWIWLERQTYPQTRSRSYYRLVAGALPAASEIYPLGGRRGETVKVQLRGGTLTGAKVVTATLEPLRGEVDTRLRAISDRPGPDGVPLDIEPLPSLITDDLAEVLEPVIPEAPPSQSAPPVVFNGRLHPRGDEDRFTLLVKPGQKLLVNVEVPHLPGVLEVLDARGSVLVTAKTEERRVYATLDRDHEIDYVAAELSAEFTVPPKESKVVLVLREDPTNRRYNTAGALWYPYRIKVVPVAPGFEVVLNDAQISLPRAGTVVVRVTVVRKGFAGPIALRVADLPAGVTFRAGTITEGQTSGSLTVAATADVTFGPVVLNLVGEGQAPGGPVIARAKKIILFGQQTTIPFSRIVDKIGDRNVYVEVPPFLRTRLTTQEGLFTAPARSAPLAPQSKSGGKAIGVQGVSPSP